MKFAILSVMLLILALPQDVWAGPGCHDFEGSPTGHVLHWTAVDIARAKNHGYDEHLGWHAPTDWPPPGHYTFYRNPCSSARGLMHISPLVRVRWSMMWLTAFLLLAWLATVLWGARSREFRTRAAPYLLDPLPPLAWIVTALYLTQGVFTYGDGVHALARLKPVGALLFIGGTLLAGATWCLVRQRARKCAAVLSTVLVVVAGGLAYRFGLVLPEPVYITITF